MDFTNILATFLEGLLSFLSPCVLPLVPLYMAYLSGESNGEDNIKFKTFIRTIFFVLGIFSVFALLALSLSTVQKYINEYKDIISIIGGVLIFVFGLNELGIINISFLNVEKRINVDIKPNKMNLLKAFFFGFIFAFGWTPCIGPMLTSALLLAATSSSGVVYLFSYALGLIIPFIITGLFTSFVLSFIKDHKKIMNYVLKIAGIILIIFSIYLIYTASRNIIHAKELQQRKENRNEEYVYVPDTKFKDVYGNEYDLNDYYGKYIFLDLSATWCGYCRQELPAYQKFNEEHDDVVCFIVMNHEFNNGTDDQDILDYIKENNVEIPILLDTNGDIFSFGYNGVPFMWIVGPDSSLVAYQPGALNDEYFSLIYESVKQHYLER